MKKIIMLVGIIGIMFLLVPKSYAAPLTTESYVTPEDVSIVRMEYNRKAITDYCNSFPGSSIQDTSITTTQLDANSNPENRWNEAFSDFVYTGLLPATGTRAAAVIPLGTAYVEGVRIVKDETIPGATNYPATKWIYVDLSSNGTYTYSDTTIDQAVPSVAANSIRLARVSTDSTHVTVVRDDRVTSVQITQNEDFYRSGLSIYTTATTTIVVQPGTIYHGTTRVSKTADTTLALATATDWASGAQATSTKGYVVVNVGGDIRLTTTAPTKTDTSGNSAGDLRYSVISTVYWRVIGSFYMNATGSGEVFTSTVVRTTPDLAGPSDWSDTKLAGTIVQVQSIVTGISSIGATVMPFDDTIPQIDEGDEYMSLMITPTSTTNKLKIDVVWVGVPGAAGGTSCVALFQDATGNALAVAHQASYAIGQMQTVTFSYYMVAGTVSATTFRVRAGTVSGTTYFNGNASGRLFGGKMASSITITEVKG